MSFKGVAAANTPQKRWRWYTSAADGPVVRREMDALEVEGRAALADAMNRLIRGELLPREDEPLEDGLRALRVFVGNNPYRLIYSYEGRRAVLALLAIYKNQQKLPRSVIAKAKSRRAKWRERGDL